MSPSQTFLATGTKVCTGSIFCVQVIADATFTTIDGLDGDSFAAVTIPAGTYIYGNFSKVTLATGKAFIYLVSRNGTLV